MDKPRKKSSAAHLKHHQWKPGQTGNPNGRPTISKEQREFRKLTIEKYREVIEIALTGNLEELKAIAEDPNTPAIQVGVATTLLRGIKTGDISILERFASRIVGKIPDEIRINSVNYNANDKVGSLSDDDLKARLKRIRSGV